jgi:hypothetical protein
MDRIAKERTGSIQAFKKRLTKNVFFSSAIFFFLNQNDRGGRRENVTNERAEEDVEAQFTPALFNLFSRPMKEGGKRRKTTTTKARRVLLLSWEHQTVAKGLRRKASLRPGTPAHHPCGEEGDACFHSLPSLHAGCRVGQRRHLRQGCIGTADRWALPPSPPTLWCLLTPLLTLSHRFSLFPTIPPRLTTRISSAESETRLGHGSRTKAVRRLQTGRSATASCGERRESRWDALPSLPLGSLGKRRGPKQDVGKVRHADEVRELLVSRARLSLWWPEDRTLRRSAPDRQLRPGGGSRRYGSGRGLVVPPVGEAREAYARVRVSLHAGGLDGPGGACLERRPAPGSRPTGKRTRLLGVRTVVERGPRRVRPNLLQIGYLESEEEGDSR